MLWEIVAALVGAVVFAVVIVLPWPGYSIVVIAESREQARAEKREWLRHVEDALHDRGLVGRAVAECLAYASAYLEIGTDPREAAIEAERVVGGGGA